MVDEAEEYRSEDRRRKEKVEVRNEADAAAYSAEKFLREQGDQVPDVIRSKVEAKIASVKDALEGDGIDAIRRRTEELGQAMQEIGSKMYETAGAAGAAPGAGASGAEPEGDDGDDAVDDEDIIDGEFSEA
jgi:molecular chaperone DnaK